MLSTMLALLLSVSTLYPPSDSGPHPQPEPEKIVKVVVVRIPPDVPPIAGKLCHWAGLTLDCGAMSSIKHVSESVFGRPVRGGTFRSYAMQAACYAARPGICAPPGTSLHEEGLAIDVVPADNTDVFRRVMLEHGWAQFAPSFEPWHYSYRTVG